MLPVGASMANTSSYAAGNRFERVQAPPYFQANNRPFWPSLTWSASLTLAANDPLYITRPNVEPQMVPVLFFNGETNGLLVDSISVRYTGAIATANTLFIYELYNFDYYCIGAIPLPVSASSVFPQPSGGSSVLGQGDPGSMPNPPVLLGTDTIRYGLRLMANESIYLGIEKELDSPIVVSAWGQRYSRLEQIATELGSA